MSQRYLGGVITANPTTPTLTTESGVWTLEQQFQYSSVWSPKIIGNSVRLRSSASAYLNRTLTTPTSGSIWTYSLWVKRGALNINQQLLSAGAAVSDQIYFQGGGTDKLIVYLGASQTTTQVFRDPSAWYHFVFAIDTTQATASNRLKIYLNGTQITAFDATGYPTQNSSTKINSAVAHYIGRYAASATDYVDGYLAEVNFIDGQALTPSSFGAFDTNGVWQPLQYTGTYGTNGFYLTFADNSAATATTLGKDYSGNGNNWTPNNISVTAGVTYDWMLDSPTNWIGAAGGNGVGNYCVINAISKPANVTLSNGNLTAAMSTTSGHRSVASTFYVSTGSWFWEITPTTVGSGSAGIGVANTSFTIGNEGAANTYFYYADGTKAINGTYTSYGASYTSNDVIGVAFDATNGTLTFYKNGTSQGQITGIPTGVVYVPFMCSNTSVSASTFVANFGQRPFTYTPPTGYKALNTQNLPAVNITNGAQYMAATTYTGNGTSQSINNGANNAIGTTFQPDFVWIKNRTQAYNHILQDSVRGTGVYLSSSTTDAESAVAGTLTSFNSNGYSIGSAANANANGETYVGWQWKAGGTAVSNNAGSITSSVSANTTAGFSVVTYTGTGVNATVGHGLGVAPKMIIAKHRNAVDNWIVYQASLGGSPDYLWLNLTSAKGTSSAVWNTAPTSTVFGVGTDNLTNLSGGTYVAYCWSEVAGYSKFGSYTGNGSTDGVFVYCGFRPRYVLVKASSAVEGWVVWDSARDTYNAMPDVLYPNGSNAEVGSTQIDFLSNGFKLRNSATNGNISGNTYIFAAFAENPFNIARAR